MIHTVGPVWGSGERGEDRLLANCYLNSFALGLKHDLVSIAYPAISTGAYGFPAGRAASIALRTVFAAIETAPAMQRVIFCCFGAESREHHERALAAIIDEA